MARIVKRGRFTPLGEGKVTELCELVPARIERQLHVQQKVRCRCGEAIITADAPAKVFDKTRFGPTFIAQIAVSKCADSLPLYRQAKAYRRVGVEVNAVVREPRAIGLAEDVRAPQVPVRLQRRDRVIRERYLPRAPALGRALLVAPERTSGPRWPKRSEST